MTPLTTKTIFIPIPIEKGQERLPSDQNPIIFFDSGDICRFEDDPLPPAIITHWLKEQEGYFLTRKEMEKLLVDAFESGSKDNRQREHLMNAQFPNKTQYLQSILPLN